MAPPEIAKDDHAVSRSEPGTSQERGKRHGIAEICREIRRHQSVVAMPAEGKRYRGWALVYGQRGSLWR